MHPKTDIICLVYNNLAVTQNFVKNLFKNTKNFELIFVDNGSTDAVKQFLIDGYNHNKWKLLVNSNNEGIISGRNQGAQQVEADYFVNLDNDQYVQDGWLDLLHDLINRGNFDIVGKEAWRLTPPKTSGIININGNNISDRSYFPVYHCKNFGDKFTYIGCGGMLIKKTVYNHIGLFDPIFNPAYYEDPDFCFSAIKAGYKLGWCYNCPIDHLEHQTLNKSINFNKNQQFIQSWNRFKKKWFPFNPPLHQTLIK